eukprot:CAMPEP_0181089258 /NCGR_PEP_ID=MMETSP1071-20121207/7208_1 /TAXON_ID=35127 /ORGANISM="Thalassiosira sp., Strain NH16" /LENGTH=447 /DNA_ID=CAMNT_0023171197 /DNA_START=105 /DNA_END=1445 /DNA_ORIENTATION=-
MAFANSNSNPAAAAAPPSPSSLLSNKHVCISGGGPCGLFLATLLLRQDPTVRITILERSQRAGKGGDINAFGIGLGARLLHSLDAVPGLRGEVESVSAGPTPRGLRIVSRSDLSERMTCFLEGMDGNNGRCRIRFGEGCDGIDLEDKHVTTTAGRKIQYDLLIGADGINSSVRRALVDRRGLREVHYLEPSNWKSLQLPPQPEFDAKSIRPRHPRYTIALLPRYPEGHILLIFWGGKEKGGTSNNPGNLNTPVELKSMLSDAFQDEKSDMAYGDKEGTSDDVARRRRNVVFDDNAVNIFLKTRPGRSHYMKINRFDDDSVALIGDAAHGMNSLLGQGCAAGLKYAEVLAEELCGPGSLSESKHLNDALRSYSKRAVRGAHAIIDLNRMGATMVTAGPVLKALLVPIMMLQKIFQRKSIFEQIMKVDVPYEDILRDNLLLLPLAKLKW